MQKEPKSGVRIAWLDSLPLKAAAGLILFKSSKVALGKWRQGEDYAPPAFIRPPVMFND